MQRQDFAGKAQETFVLDVEGLLFSFLDPDLRFIQPRIANVRRCSWTQILLFIDALFCISITQKLAVLHLKRVYVAKRYRRKNFCFLRLGIVWKLDFLFEFRDWS